MQRLIGRKRTDEIPPLEGPDGLMTNDYEKATLLNYYFVSKSTLTIPESHQPPLKSDPKTPVPALESIRTNEHEVLTLLNVLDPNKSTGSDKIYVKLFKMCALIIAEPLSCLFNKSFASETYTLLHLKKRTLGQYTRKKGSPSDSTCYRPISILSTISKVFEKLYIEISTLI